MLGLRLVSSVATMLVATMLGLRSTDEVALTGPKVELRKFARRFSSSVKVNGDIDVRRFVSAGEEFSHAVERFGDFTRRGVVDARKNLKRVEKAAGGRVVSMQVLLRDARTWRQTFRTPLARGGTRSAAATAGSHKMSTHVWFRISTIWCCAALCNRLGLYYFLVCPRLRFQLFARLPACQAHDTHPSTAPSCDAPKTAHICSVLPDPAKRA